MRWLIYGGHGWIGSQLCDYLKQIGEDTYVGVSRVNDRASTYKEVHDLMPDRVICAIGRLSGPSCSNIDYLEQSGKLVENLRDNLQGPITLAYICQELKIHMTYLGTGCIYEYDEQHPLTQPELCGYTEEDIPNFTGSQYSLVKGVTDQLIRTFNTTLNVRIRMPISPENHSRNFVTKIVGYPKIISIPNSMTVLPELLPIIVDMATKSINGTINMVNPGVITHEEILQLYKKYVDPTISYTIMDLSELSHYVVGRRSNNYLDTHKLQSLYPNVLPIKESVEQMFKNSRTSENESV